MGLFLVTLSLVLSALFTVPHSLAWNPLALPRRGALPTLEIMRNMPNLCISNLWGRNGMAWTKAWDWLEGHQIRPWRDNAPL